MRAKDIACVMRRIMNMVLVAGLLAFQSGGFYGTARAESFEEHQVLVGDIISIPTKALSRISITDPDVADISDAKPSEITLMGKSPGQTILFIWEGAAKRAVIVRVMSQDLSVIRARIQGLLDNAGISTVQMNESQTEGKIVLTGEIPENKADFYSKITGPFYDQILDLTKTEESTDLVQIDMQITELKTTLNKVMGIDWFSGGSGDAKTSLNLSVQEKLPFDGKQGSQSKDQMRIQDIFRVGHLYRTSTILAQVDALITKGKATILSKPRLVVKSGKEASFLVGGEIPILTSTGTAGVNATISQNVEYKEYGVSLSVTPTIKEGKVEIQLTTEISDIDASTPISSSKEGVAFQTRSATTELLLDDHQTIVLAGLIRKDRSHYDKRVPLLGSIPILGLLFRNTGSQTPDSDSEVVISLTPTIIHGSKPQAEALKAVEAKTELPRSVEPGTEEDLPPLTGVTSRDTIGIPPITKNVGTVSVNVPQAVAPYVQAVQEKISSAIAFPYEAQQNGWQGTVKLALVVKKDGSLRDVFVKESSGYEVFDHDAVNTAQILAPYAPFSDNIKEEELSLTIPIVYSQDSFLKNVAKRN